MRKSAAAWVLYDIASSGYILLITAVAFPLYFKFHVAQNAPWSDALWGFLLAISSIVAGLVAPLLGAAADISSRRLAYLAWATAVSSAATMLLALNAPLPVVAFLFCISYMAYLIAAALYDALLKTVSQGADASWLSSFGWGLGYAGGLLCYFLSSTLSGFGTASQPMLNFEISFVVVGVYYALLGGAAILGMRNAELPDRAYDQTKLWQSSLRRIVKTGADWSAGGQTARCIVGAYLLAGAATALGLFTPILLASHFVLDAAEIARLSAVFSIVSIPATLLAGWAALRIGSYAVLCCTLPLWLMLIVLLIVGEGWWMGLAVALCLGAAIGPTNSTARSLAANIVSKADAAEMFGFAAMVQRLSSAGAPLLFGLVSSAASARWPPLAMGGALLLAGFIVLPRRLQLGRNPGA